MRLPLKVRWIVTLLILAIGSQALVFAPGLHNVAAVFWGLSFVLLVAALVLAVQRYREVRQERSS